jgi:Ca-activated chloride channel family protein
VDGKPVEGKVLSAEEARKTYEEIVRTQRDPALLEYAGRGAVQARIFPIPPDGERRIELEYTQALTADHGLVQYIYPLNTEKFSNQPLENVSIKVEIRSSIPIRAAYSPTHNVSLDWQDNHHIIAGYEATNIKPDSDFGLYYSLGEEQAFHLLSFRDPADLTDPDGFFLLMLAPRPDVSQSPLPKDLILVLDHSGSMEGEKFQQAQEAARYILNHLNPEDRFNLIAFSTEVDPYASSLQPATNASQAISWIDHLSAAGSTDINRALLEAAALVDPERPTYAIFLTDGLPTEGEIDSQKILNNLSGAAPKNFRLFTFGVGFDVDTVLLDSLAQEHHGASTYVKPGERLDEILSGFYTRISTPVLTDLKLDFAGVSAYDIYPDPLPDLFAGSSITITGRYHGEGGTATLTLTGKVNSLEQTFTYSNEEFSAGSSDSGSILSALPRLWATRKIGYLLTQVRLHGADRETIDQIVKLSIRYGIVTEYTSYLVTEPMPLDAVEQDRIAEQQYQSLATAPAIVSGSSAVQKAAGQNALAGAETAPSLSAASDQVHQIGSRTFVLSDGVWIDTTFHPDTMKTTKVAFLSDDYFTLTEAHPELAAAFSQGERVIVLSGNTAYEVVRADEAVSPLVIAPTSTPSEPEIVSQPGNTQEPIGTPAASQAPVRETARCGFGLLPLILLLLSMIILFRRR